MPCTNEEIILPRKEEGEQKEIPLTKANLTESKEDNLTNKERRRRLRISPLTKATEEPREDPTTEITFNDFSNTFT